MAKLDFTKPEMVVIMSKVYFTEDEEKILDMWLKEKTIDEMAEALVLSPSTISRKKAKIIKKITKVL